MSKSRSEKVAKAASEFLVTCDKDPIYGMTADQGFLWDKLAQAVQEWEGLEGDDH